MSRNATRNMLPSWCLNTRPTLLFPRFVAEKAEFPYTCIRDETVKKGCRRDLNFSLAERVALTEPADHVTGTRIAHGNASCECVSCHMPTSAEVCEGYGKEEDDNDEERAERR